MKKVEFELNFKQWKHIDIEMRDKGILSTGNDMTMTKVTEMDNVCKKKQITASYMGREIPSRIRLMLEVYLRKNLSGRIRLLD